MRINGSNYDYVGMTISECLNALGLDQGRVVVECNNVIIPKDKFSEIVAQPDDVIEIVQFVGGG